MDLEVPALVGSLSLFYSPWWATGSDIVVPTRQRWGPVA